MRDSTRRALRWAHIVVSVFVGAAVPIAIYLVNGEVEIWAFVLGAVIGFMYWYFGPLMLPF